MEGFNRAIAARDNKVLTKNKVYLLLFDKTFAVFPAYDREVENEVNEIIIHLNFGPEGRTDKLLGDKRVDIVIFHHLPNLLVGRTFEVNPCQISVGAF